MLNPNLCRSRTKAQNSATACHWLSYCARVSENVALGAFVALCAHRLRNQEDAPPRSWVSLQVSVHTPMARQQAISFFQDLNYSISDRILSQKSLRSCSLKVLQIVLSKQIS
ncbi:hypothetical protein CapIbe_008502 [Capra ibex]